LPIRRIDHIFVGDGFRVLNTEVPRTRLTRVASDHLPLVVDLELTPVSRARSGEPLARTAAA
jgi:endonuclease/exonuclease/phosphatase family metal-dependent hydrolase